MKQTQFKLTSFNEETGEKTIGFFNTKKEALAEAKSIVFAQGRGDKSTFRHMSRLNIWTNDPTGMLDGGLTITRVSEIE